MTWANLLIRSVSSSGLSLRSMASSSKNLFRNAFGDGCFQSSLDAVLSGPWAAHVVRRFQDFGLNFFRCGGACFGRFGNLYLTFGYAHNKAAGNLKSRRFQSGEGIGDHAPTHISGFTTGSSPNRLREAKRHCRRCRTGTKSSRNCS